MRQPKAVLISDLHFTPNTLELASSALIDAIMKAKELRVPLIIAGDTLDSKAIVRGECANRLIEIFTTFLTAYRTYMIVGNHDMLNEKGKEHALNFLRPYVEIVDEPLEQPDVGAILLPYYSDTDALKAVLSGIPEGSTIIMHQGVQTAYMGHYAQDKSSLPPETFANFRVISGHYHRAQDIKCGRPQKGAVGLFSYIGTPYTTSFAEAKDGPKGFKILYDDGLLELVDTRLRRHLVFELNAEGPLTIVNWNSDDLVWIKVTGTPSQLATIKREKFVESVGHANFKLELIPVEVEAPLAKAAEAPTSVTDLFDTLISNIAETDNQKTYLQKLWKEVLDETA